LKTLLPADPKLGYLARKEEIDSAIARVLESGRYILGPEVEQFEQEFAAFVGVQHCIGVGNGTDALELALRALGIGSGDVVITTSNTAVATVAAIELAGATPLLVEVDDETLTISPRALELALATTPAAAVIPVHLYGRPADMPQIMRIAEQHQLRVIEDCAQAHGATIDGRQVGTWGDAAAFSFYPTKNLAALGDGGAVVTDDQQLATRLRDLRMYGWRERYISETAGMNTRLDELQAAILRVQLRHLAADNDRRRELAARYSDSLGGPAPPAGHVYHQYVIRSSRRDELREHLRQRQIETAILYPQPIHLQPAYRGRIATAGELPVTERAARELLCLPMHPWLSDSDADRVAAAILQYG
jgi:dTDP-4-amino-4,6-dideoxygalactose transaminase